MFSPSRHPLPLANSIEGHFKRRLQYALSTVHEVQNASIVTKPAHALRKKQFVSNLANFLYIF
jgi:hypothetical protein